MMKQFTLFVDYAPKHGGERRFTPPILVAAANEEDASKTASAVADFAYSEVASELIIRILGDDPNGRPVGEIRRPFSN